FGVGLPVKPEEREAQIDTQGFIPCQLLNVLLDSVCVAMIEVPPEQAQEQLAMEVIVHGDDELPGLLKVFALQHCIEQLLIGRVAPQGIEAFDLLDGLREEAGFYQWSDVRIVMPGVEGGGTLQQALDVAQASQFVCIAIQA